MQINILFLGKLIESVVADQLRGILDETYSLDPFQSGFRLCHYTETALVSLQDHLLKVADRGRATLLVLLDLPAAFDAIQPQYPPRKTIKFRDWGLCFFLVPVLP